MSITGPVLGDFFSSLVSTPNTQAPPSTGVEPTEAAPNRGLVDGFVHSVSREAGSAS
jgi:hypothetical protein